jgi:hypothetical protein
MNLAPFSFRDAVPIIPQKREQIKFKTSNVIRDPDAALIFTHHEIDLSLGIGYNLLHGIETARRAD